jgi:hypothetical protein
MLLDAGRKIILLLLLLGLNFPNHFASHFKLIGVIKTNHILSA